MADYLLP